MEWELSKENYVPVKAGRGNAVLAELVDPTDSATKQALDQKRRELLQQVRNHSGDDPLEAWVRLIKWTQEHLVGGSKLELQKTLEACTQQLMRHDRYKTDIRFLRIWIQYADCLPDPGDVFLFLKEKQVGQDFALFYEAYATYFELRGNFPSADAMYQQGVNRGAKPLERLKQKHSAFQNRMAQRIQRKVQDDPSSVLEQSQPVRQTLSSIGAAPFNQQPSRRMASGVLGAMAPQLPLSGTPHSLLGTQQPQNPTAAGTSMLSSILLGSHGNSRQQGGHTPLLVDDEFKSAQASRQSLPSFAAMPQVDHIKQLNPYNVIRKENMAAPGIWTEASVQQAQGVHAAAGRASALEICVDDEFLDEPASSKAPAQQPLPVFSQPAPSGGAASALASIFNIRDGPTTLVPAAPSAMLASTPASQVASSNEGYSAALLLDATGNEHSFEEARAMVWWLKNQSSPEQANQSFACGSMQDAAALNPAQAASMTGLNNMSISLGLPRLGEPIACTPAHRPAAVGESQAAALSGPPKHDGAGNPTTQKPSTAKRRPLGAVPVEPKRPLALAGMFQDAAACQPESDRHVAAVQEFNLAVSSTSVQPSSLASVMPAQDLYDANITLSTKQAFDDINSMFNDTLQVPGLVSRSTAGDASQEAGAAGGQLHKKRPLQTHSIIPEPVPQPVPAPSAVLPTGQDTNCLDVHDIPAPRPAMHEPTVTINTLAAFNAINDMFSDALPHESTRAPKGTLGKPSAPKPITATDVCRLANRGLGTGPAVKQTSVAPLPHQHTGVSSSFSMHEDIDFMTKSVAGGAVFEDTEMLGPAGGLADVLARTSGVATTAGRKDHGSGPFMLYEDTQFITSNGATQNSQAQPAAASGLGDFCIHEDTDFLTRHISAAMPQPSAAPLRLASSGQGGMFIHEDTEFMTRDISNLPTQGRPGTFKGYQDTVTLAAARKPGQVKPGGALFLAPPHA